jgi:hypothetical protein
MQAWVVEAGQIALKDRRDQRRRSMSEHGQLPEGRRTDVQPDSFSGNAQLGTLMGMSDVCSACGTELEDEVPG